MPVHTRLLFENSTLLFCVVACYIFAGCSPNVEDIEEELCEQIFPAFAAEYWATPLHFNQFYERSETMFWGFTQRLIADTSSGGRLVETGTIVFATLECPKGLSCQIDSFSLQLGYGSVDGDEFNIEFQRDEIMLGDTVCSAFYPIDEATVPPGYTYWRESTILVRSTPDINLSCCDIIVYSIR